jgi:putative ABC transport system permease protein
MKLISHLRSLLNTDRSPSNDELDEELLSHIQNHADDLERSGLPRPEAERRARIAFGSPEKAKESVREQRPGFFLETLANDIRFALRILRKSPGFTCVAILTLALGIGANTAIFSVVDAVLLRPLPYAQPDRLVTVTESERPFDLLSKNEVAPGNFVDWRARNRVFAEIGASHMAGYSITGEDRPERVQIANISAGMLHMLGLRPAMGREFNSSDDRNGAPRVLMLTDELWKSRYAADPNIVGKIIHLDTNPYTVVGVLPRGLVFPRDSAQIWVPLEQTITPADLHWYSSHYLEVYARLKPGVTVTQASQEMSRIAAQIKKEQPQSNSGAAALVIPLQEDLSGEIRPALLTLLAAVGFVLLIACANVANLFLVRAVGRSKELATRMALGAGKARLIRQMLTESVILSLAGGGAGLLVANWTRQLLLALSPNSLPQSNVIGTDSRVLLFTLLISVSTGLLFGIVPALSGTGVNLSLALHGTSRSATSGKSTQRLRNLLVAAEIAISLVLLTGAGLTIRSFLQLRNTNLGFRSDHTITARITIPKDKYSKEEQVVSFYDQVLERIHATAGVESAGLISYLPLTGNTFDNSFDIVGQQPRPESDRTYGQIRFVDPDYFGVLDIPLLSGRGFTAHDRLGSARSIVISETMANRFFPGANPVGQHLVIYLGKDETPWQVVGIVGDVRTEISSAAAPVMYLPYAQNPYRYMVLTIRTHANTGPILESVRATVNSIDPDLPVYQTRTLAELIDDSLDSWRFSMTLLCLFAAMALLLAAAGIYGVMAYLVEQRTHEVGVRMALGAQRSDVLRLVVGHGAKLALVGVLAGLVASFALTRLMSSLLVNVSATDPLTLSAVASLLLSVALAACYFPARRAASVEPVVALRNE